MRLKNKIKQFPSYLTDEFRSIIDLPKPVRSDGIIYKRYPTHGKFTEEEMDYLITNQIPY